MSKTFQHIGGIDIYTSSPSEHIKSNEPYIKRLREVAQWSDRYGCRGMLIYTDNRASDPWVLAQDVITCTNTLRPLIAVQPVYMHPYAVSQKITTLAEVYGRAVDLNFVAGGFQFDLAALGDKTAHDDRYERLSEYGEIVTTLLRGERVTVQGKHYNIFGLKLDRAVSNDLLPGLTVSGSSPSGRNCAKLLGAVAVMYPEPFHGTQPPRESELSQIQGTGLPVGIRIGILARETASDAWQEAKLRFPNSPQGQTLRKAAVQVTDSSWLHQLSTIAGAEATVEHDVYWMGPFTNGKSFCPYLVGSYSDVAAYLSCYFRNGVRFVILDCPNEEQDLAHARTAIQRSANEIRAEGMHDEHVLNTDNLVRTDK